jgi:hypothetical protein
MHDLIIVAVLDADLAQRPSRNDLQIALDRYPQRVEPELVQHLGYADSAHHPAVLAVDSDTQATIETH